jgi:hypothetical protein
LAPERRQDSVEKYSEHWQPLVWRVEKCVSWQRVSDKVTILWFELCLKMSFRTLEVTSTVPLFLLSVTASGSWARRVSETALQFSPQRFFKENVGYWEKNVFKNSNSCNCNGFSRPFLERI